MPRKKAYGKITISVPQTILERLERLRENNVEVNVSKVCSDALHVYLLGEEYPLIDAEADKMASQDVESDPDLAELYVKRGIPPRHSARFTEWVRKLPEDVQDRAISSYRAGTVNALERMAQQQVPFEYKPPKDEPDK